MSSLAEAVTAFAELRAERARLALATLVAVHGPAATLPGARMWLTADGRLGGAVTLGGCADARILEALRAALAGTPAGRVTASLGEDAAYSFGMSCTGGVEVFVEVLDFGRAADVALWASLHGTLKTDRQAVLVTRLAADGGRWLVGGDGHDSHHGQTVHDSHDGLHAGSAALPPMPIYQASLNALGATGPSVRLESCGGDEVLLETLVPRPQLIVVGAGPVAAHLSAMAPALGYRSTVVDARPDLLTPERFPSADELRLGVPDEVFDFAACDPATAVVVTAHNYAYEVPVLRAALRGGAGYLGMVAGRRRGGAVLAFLAELGIKPESLSRVQARAGLDLGGRSPAEIALSIFAEIVAQREGKGGLPLTRPAARRRDALALTRA